MVYSEMDVGKMIHTLRKEGNLSLKEISLKVVEECTTNYHCKDNVTLIIVDLNQHFTDFCRTSPKAQVLLQANSNY